MGYPGTAYRTSAARQANSAARQLSRPGKSWSDPPRPANDNVRPQTLPKPANDNFRDRLPPAPDLQDLARLTRALRPFIKIHPFFRFIGVLDDLGFFGWLMRQLNPGDMKGWVLDCESPAPCQIHNGTNCNLTFCESHGAMWGEAGACGQGHAWPPAGANLVFLPGSRFRGFYVRRDPASEPCGGGAGWLERSYSHPFDINQHPVYVPPEFPSIVEIPLGSPAFVPYKYPWVNPEILPILQPVPEPLPPPYKAIPDREMHPDSERGNDVLGRTNLRVQPVDRPLTSASPEPATGRRPPGPKEKEKKYRATGLVKWLERAVKLANKVDSKLKDFRDIIIAFNDALPKEKQLKAPDNKKLQKLLENMLRHFDDVDGLEAILNIVKEIAEDLIGGAGDALRSEAAAKMGWFKNKIWTMPRF